MWTPDGCALSTAPLRLFNPQQGGLRDLPHPGWRLDLINSASAVLDDGTLVISASQALDQAPENSFAAHRVSCAGWASDPLQAWRLPAHAREASPSSLAAAGLPNRPSGGAPHSTLSSPAHDVAHSAPSRQEGQETGTTPTGPARGADGTATPAANGAPHPMWQVRGPKPTEPPFSTDMLVNGLIGLTVLLLVGVAGLLWHRWRGLRQRAQTASDAFLAEQQARALARKPAGEPFSAGRSGASAGRPGPAPAPAAQADSGFGPTLVVCEEDYLGHRPGPASAGTSQPVPATASAQSGRRAAAATPPQRDTSYLAAAAAAIMSNAQAEDEARLARRRRILRWRAGLTITVLALAQVPDLWTLYKLRRDQPAATACQQRPEGCGQSGLIAAQDLPGPSARETPSLPCWLIGRWTSQQEGQPARQVTLADNGRYHVAPVPGKDRMAYTGRWMMQGEYLVWQHNQSPDLAADPNLLSREGDGRFVLREQNGSHTVFTRVQQVVSNRCTR
jgi:hypothetical protein